MKKYSPGKRVVSNLDPMPLEVGFVITNDVVEGGGFIEIISCDRMKNQGTYEWFPTLEALKRNREQ